MERWGVEPERTERGAVVRGGGGTGGKSGGGKIGLPGLERKTAGEVTVGVGPEVDDQVKLGELGGKIRREGRRRVEGAPPGIVLGMDVVDKTSVDGEGRGGEVADEFDPCGGPASAEEG